MVSMQNGQFVPMRFQDIFDPKTNRTAVRMVDVSSEYFRIARAYMIRLSREDIESEDELAKLAGTAGQAPEEFLRQFSPILEKDLLYINTPAGKSPYALKASPQNA